MKTLVVIRHSLTRKGRAADDSGSHLSSEGVRLARDLGGRLPDFEHVAVGDQPRHLETALALGYAVDEQVGWPSGYVRGVVDHHDQWDWSEPFVRYATLLADDTGLRPIVDEHLRHWRRMLGAVPHGSAVLIVSSGGSIEPVLVAALPWADHASWGGAFHQLEGASLSWNGAGFQSLRMIRRGAGSGPE